MQQVSPWLGLCHPFENGCEAPGCYVDDTPYQLYPTSGCPATAPYSCGLADPDPISNFMDYSDDDCMDEFSENQSATMLATITRYRPWMLDNRPQLMHYLTAK